eukprot:Awhi_evm1s7414
MFVLHIVGLLGLLFGFSVSSATSESAETAIPLEEYNFEYNKYSDFPNCTVTNKTEKYEP